MSDDMRQFEEVVDHQFPSLTVTTNGTNLVVDMKGGYKEIRGANGDHRHEPLDMKKYPLIGELSRFCDRMMKKYNMGGCPLCGGRR